MHSKLDVNLEEGFSVFFVLNIAATGANTRKVIYQLKKNESPLRLTLFLNQKDELVLSFVDQKGAKYFLGPIDISKYLDKYVVLCCEFHNHQQLGSNSSHCKMKIFIDDLLLGEKEIECDLGDPGEGLHSIGMDDRN